ncbi:MAG: cytochrome c3 family protein [Desulfobacterales bacterium]
MTARICLLLAAAMLVFTAASLALGGALAENKGAAEITLPGGSRGPVPFPHHQHQDKLVDCNICHSLYPQKAGIIEELKAAGTLKKKQVMNKQCTKCHKQKKTEGLKAGPTTCVKCHIKEEK